MKFLFFTAAIALQLLAATVCFSQNDSIPQRRELCFSTGSFDHYSLIYKKKLSAKSFSRVSGIFSNSIFGWTRNDSSNSYEAKLDFSVSVGRETRKFLDKNLWFVQGYEVFFNTRINAAKAQQSRADYSMAIGYGRVFGLLFDINSRWAINLETIPSIWLRQDFYFDGKTGRFNVNFWGSSGAGLTIVRKLAS